MLSRRSFMQSLAAGAAALAAGPSLQAASAAAQRPNIIFFLVDDMGWFDTSLPFLYKDGKPVVTKINRRFRTPNMEAMAKEGMMLTDAYAHAICSPTRVSLMSGMNAARHRVTNWTLEIDNPRHFRPKGENGLVTAPWACNGLQPQGTQPSGTCADPWVCTGFVPNKTPGVFSYGTEQKPYRMKLPYVCALTLPAVLRAGGYYTIHCGKAHWGAGQSNWITRKGMSTPGADPRNFGFDVNIAGREVGGPGSFRGENWYANINGCARWATPDLAEYCGKTQKDLTYRTPGLGDGKPIFLSDALTDKALRTVKKHLETKYGQPFCLYMSHYAVHAPVTDPVAWDAARSDNVDFRKDTVNPDPKDGRTWSAGDRNYATLVRSMDDSLGTIRRFLKDNGLEENTLLIFMADNGGIDGHVTHDRAVGSNLPLRAGKGSCYEGGTRECCIAQWVGKIGAGTRSSEPILIEDFYPTLLEAAGLPLPADAQLAVTPGSAWPDGRPLKQKLDGNSILPVLLGRRATVRPDGRPRTLMWHTSNSCGFNVRDIYTYNFYTAVRRGPWKLIYQHGKPKNRTFELYNLERDIGEQTNLAGKHPDIVRSLRKEMADLLRDREAMMPTLGKPNGPRVPWPDDPSLD